LALSYFFSPCVLPAAPSLYALCLHDSLPIFDRLAPVVVRDADDRDFLDGRMLIQHALDLGGPDFEPAGIDLVLLAVDHIKPAFGIHIADVTGAQFDSAAGPAQRVFSLLGLIPVPGHDLRAPGDELADFAGIGLGAVIADDAYDRIEHRDTYRQRSGGFVDRRRAAERHPVRGRVRLGQAVKV